MKEDDKPRRSDLKREVAIVAEPWKDSSYYGSAERWTSMFWDPHTLFRKRFETLSLDSVVELACGHGRHAQKIANRCGALTLMDVVADNIKFCRRRLREFNHINYIVNDGHSFAPVADASVTAIFSYDAMVHFSDAIIAAYLHDARRILVPGGRALFHHSNFAGPPAIHYGLNPHSRNVMTKARFGELARASRLKVVSQDVLAWGGVRRLDCLTLVERPGPKGRRRSWFPSMMERWRKRRLFGRQVSGGSGRQV